MNNLENNGESLLRNKLLEHEFAADEQAWEKMDALLDAHPASALPPAGASASGLLWLTGGKWLLGIMAVVLVAWWLAAPRHPEGGATSIAAPDGKAPAPLSAVTPPESGIIVSSANISVEKNTALAEPPLLQKKVENEAVTQKKTTGRSALAAVDAPARRMNMPTVRSRKSPIYAARRDLSNQQINTEGSAVSGPAQANTLTPPERSNRPASDLSSSSPTVDSLTSSPVRITQQNASGYVDMALLPQRTAGLPGSQWLARAPIPWTAPPQRRRRIQIGVVGGGQVAYTPNGPYRKTTIAPTFGLSAKSRLTPRWSVQADLMYRSVQYNLRASFAQDRLDASGWYNYWQYSAWTNDLEFFEMPLLAKRAFFNGNFNLIGGLRPAFVRPAHMDSGTSGVSVGLSSYEPFQAFQPTIRTGIRRFDMALTIGAELQLRRNLWLDVRVNQGVLDLTHDDFFHNTDTDVSMDAQVTLRYYFISF